MRRRRENCEDDMEEDDETDNDIDDEDDYDDWKMEIWRWKRKSESSWVELW